MNKTHALATTLAVIGATLAPTAAFATIDSPDATAAPVSAARAKTPWTITVNDPVMTGSPQGYDITSISLTAASPYHDAIATLVLSDRLSESGDAFTVWFNLDRDRKPEAGLWFYAGSIYEVRKVTGWSKKGKDVTGGCHEVSGGEDMHTIEFDPNCFGNPKTMAISVETSHYDPQTQTYRAKDYAPGRHQWTKRVRTWNSHDIPYGE